MKSFSKGLQSYAANNCRKKVDCFTSESSVDSVLSDGCAKTRLMLVCVSEMGNM